MKEDIGRKLRRAREAQDLTLEEVARETLMRPHYLEALEAGRFEALPSMAQARGFLRSYARFLNLDAADLLADMNGEAIGSESQSAHKDVAPSAPNLSHPHPAPVSPLPNREPNHTPPPEEEAKAAPASPRPDELPKAAREIFTGLGSKLQKQRELLGISMEDVERHTHLRVRYLKALEAGRLEDLPSPVQGRGMLNNYASFLGLNPEPLLLEYADGLQARLAAKQASQTKPSLPVSRRLPKLPTALRRVVSGELIAGVVLIVFLAVFTVWGAIRIFAMRSDQEPTPTAPSIAEVLLAPPTTTSTPTTVPPTPTLPAVAPTGEDAQGETSEQTLPPPGDGDGVQVYVTVQQRAWMLVRVDGDVEFEGRVLPGSAYQYSGDEQVEILTGNGAALKIFFNQRDLGPMGLFGQVVNRIYSLEGIVTPTPTITPTATRTPRVTATPVQTTTASP
jgi:cytoskeleton protein RodZ